MSRVGRAPGAGMLRKVKRGSGPAQYVLDYQDANGDRRRQALSTDRRVAERLRTDLIGKRDLHAAGLGGVEGMSMPLTELRDLHVDDLRARATPRHADTVASLLDRALAAIPGRRVRDVRVFDLVRHRSQLVAAGASNRTANHAIDRVAAMLRWGEQMGLIAASPIKSFPRLPEREKDKVCVRRAMTESEITRFLTASQADDEANRRRQANGQVYGASAVRTRPRVPQTPLWRALIETGARFGELTKATWADVDLHARVLVLRADNTKSGRTRTVPLLDGVVADLVRLRGIYAEVLGRPVKPGERAFMTPGCAAWSWSSNNAMRVFVRVLERAGIARVDARGRKIDIHALRTTCGSRMARNGASIVHTQRLLGHSSITLTERHYTDLGVEDLRAAMQGVPGTGEMKKEAG